MYTCIILFSTQRYNASNSTTPPGLRTRNSSTPQRLSPYFPWVFWLVWCLTIFFLLSCAPCLSCPPLFRSPNPPRSCVFSCCSRGWAARPGGCAVVFLPFLGGLLRVSLVIEKIIQSLIFLWLSKLRTVVTPSWCSCSCSIGRSPWIPAMKHARTPLCRCCAARMKRMKAEQGQDCVDSWERRPGQSYGNRFISWQTRWNG